MNFTAEDLITLMQHYQMSKNPNLSFCGTPRPSTDKLRSAGLVVSYDPREMNVPLTLHGVQLAELVLDYVNEVQ